MPLPAPRAGESIGFHVYPGISDEHTLGDPETIIWSSIRQLCSRFAAEHVAARIFGIAKKKDREAVARNIKLYIQQSVEFYEAARGSKPHTAPLMYYYSFLNLAKAFCELRKPLLHERQECYRYSLSWRPDPRVLVNMETEEVSVTSRGMWHVLWESLNGVHCPAANPTKFRIGDLFAYCPEVSAEFGRTFGRNNRLLESEKLDVLLDRPKNQAWTTFSVTRPDLKDQQVSAPRMLMHLASPRSGYVEIKSGKQGLRTFQFTNPVKLRRREAPLRALQGDIIALNVFTHCGREKLRYFLANQTKIPFRLPQPIVLYTILFWLSSLVRYDPHSVASLMDSSYWILIDGFMSQSRLWLLEQFEWAFYQTETTLWLAR